MDLRAHIAEPPQWARGPATLDGDDVVLDDEAARFYTPHHESELLWDFVAITTPEDVRQYVERYGLLWTKTDADSFRELVDDWLREASVMRTVLQLVVDVRASSSGSTEADQALLTKWAPAFLDELFDARASDAAEARYQASKAVAWTIAEGLAGTEQSIGAAVADGGPPGVFLFTARPKDLRSFIYYAAALELVDRRPLGTCEECGRVFPQRDPRQRFCSKQHANRHRYRRFNERRKGTGKEES